MKTLVVYYSRHGHAKTIGDRIAKTLGADVEELVDVKDRSHLISWFKSAFDEELRTPTQIGITKYDPADYDLVIVGTPMWDGISPAVYAYLHLNKGKFKKVAFFVTFGASAENASYFMGKIIGKNPVATVEIQDRQIAVGEAKQKIKEFCKELKKKV